MNQTIDQSLQKAIKLHRAGQVQAADRIYTAIIKAQPRHPDANHNMGVLAVGIGKIKEAVPFFKIALEANPSIPQFWQSYIDALIKLHKIDDARAVFKQAKEKGIEGYTFDKLKQQLDGMKPTTSIVSKSQDPPQDKVQPIIELYSKGKLQKALDETSQLLQKFPSSVILYNISGATNQGLEQFDAAIEAYNKALSIKPDYADAYYNMGVALKERGKLQEAIEAYNKALSIKPDYADAYYNMGNTLKKRGKLKEAIEAYKKALAIKPDNADAYYNMGNTLKKRGKLKEAIEAYKRALAIKPDNADAYTYNNMGIALKERGKLKEAIEAYKRALAIKPDYAGAYINMGNALKGFTFKKPSPSLHKIITSLLDKKSYVRPNTIARAVISLLKFEPNMQKHLQPLCFGKVGPYPPQEIIAELSRLPLLLKLMSVCPLPDLELENLFIALRASLLSSISSLKGSPTLLRFQSALALQCFTNEYIYKQSEHEEKALTDLEASIRLNLSNGCQPSAQYILCLASYKALNQYEWCDLLSINDDIEEVLTRQIIEPKQEKNLKANIPVLEEITDKVSSKVREQYEASPYPRWVDLGLRLEPAPIFEVINELKLKLFHPSINNVEFPNILIAGCGTGQHSIETAARLKGSKVLAIDLSLSSLVYARRKTEELGIQNIDYMQADILELGKLDKQFDIVESVGVLHHIDDPVAGWRVLKDCLKPGGLMKIGLYSELARQPVVAIREEIRQSGIGLSDLEMKLFRTMVMHSNKNHHKRILSFHDFYSLSELKDLLFHVQEHRFSIPQIQDCIAKLELKFCGFEADIIIDNFKLTNPAEDDLYNLDKWQAYEESNPRTFTGMYQFWCQKVAIS